MIKAKTISGIGILVLLLVLLIVNELISIQCQTCMYLNIEKIINKYIKYVYIMSTVLLFVLYLWYKQRHMSNFAEFFQQYFKTLLGTETSHINYVKSVWLVQQEHTTINQEIKQPPPPRHTACFKYTSGSCDSNPTAVVYGARCL